MISQAMVEKLLANVFSIDSLGNVNCQSVTASFRYGSDRENNKPTIKPTKAAMAMDFLLRLRTSAACRFIISTEFKFRLSLFINCKLEDSSGSKFENKYFNFSSSILDKYLFKISIILSSTMRNTFLFSRATFRINLWGLICG